MIRRSLSCDAFFFLFSFLFSRRRLISVNQDLDIKTDKNRSYHTGKFRDLSTKADYSEKGKSRFSTLYMKLEK